MAVHHISKAIAFFSWLLGCLVLVVAIWTFGSLVYRFQQTLPIPSSNTTTNGVNSSTSQGSEAESFEDMPITTYFQAMIFSCDWIAVGAAILQIIISCVLFFSSKQKVQQSLKYFVGLHMVSLGVLGMTVFLPLAYDRQQDQFHTMTSFGEKLKEQFSSIGNVSLVNFMVADLHAYYATLFVDVVGVVAVIVGGSCLLRHYVVKDHQMELFYDVYK